MKVTAIKTPLVKNGANLQQILRESLSQVPENSVLAVTSKIVALCEGRVEKISTRDRKHELIRHEADYYLEPHSSEYDVMLTIKNGQLAVSAGIDESNTGGYLVMWPENPQRSAEKIWSFVRQEFSINSLGVIVTDSRSIPMQTGVMGIGIGYCGFQPIIDHRGSSDLFGRKISMVQINLVASLSQVAVCEMGEVAERTPLALIQDIRSIKFQDRKPTQKEIDSLTFSKEDDLYAPILKSVEWKKCLDK